MSVLTELQAKQQELEEEKKAILAERDAEIAAAKAKYAQALKEITKKQGAAKRMVKSAGKL